MKLETGLLLLLLFFTCVWVLRPTNYQRNLLPSLVCFNVTSVCFSGICVEPTEGAISPETMDAAELLRQCYGKRRG